MLGQDVGHRQGNVLMQDGRIDAGLLHACILEPPLGQNADFIETERPLL